MGVISSCSPEACTIKCLNLVHATEDVKDVYDAENANGVKDVISAIKVQ